MRPAPSESSKQQTELLRVTVGQWLRDRRVALGLSQKELADRAGFDYYTFISQLETGRGRVPAERYEQYAKALQVEPREFAMRMLQAYESSTYKILFPSEAMHEMERRLKALEDAVSKNQA